MKWQKFLIQLFFWLSTEVVLNLVNLDTLADYSEFLNNISVNLRSDLALAMLIPEVAPVKYRIVL